MKKTDITICILSLVCAFLFGMAAERITSPDIIYVPDEPMIDTSWIETEWCGGFSNGTIRMIGAWRYSDGVVEDEQGQLWAVDVPMDETDFFLLWIADNNTPEKQTDDFILHIYREAHN